MATYYIGADVHSNSIEMANINRKKIVKRYTIPASILERAGRYRNYSCRNYICIYTYSMAIQEEKQTLEILWCRLATNRQWN